MRRRGNAGPLRGIQPEGALLIASSHRDQTLGKDMNEESCNDDPSGQEHDALLIGHGVTMPPFTFNVSPET